MQVLDPRGSATSYTPDGFVAAVAYPDQTVSFGYDAAGNRVAMADRLGTSAWSVDWAGRVTSAKDANGAVVTYRFDLAGNETRVAYPDGRVLARVFDGRGLATAQSDGSGTTTFGFDADGEVARIGRASGVVTAIGRDLVGRVTELVHAGRGVDTSDLPMGEVNPSSMAPGNAWGHCKANGNGHPNQRPAGCTTGVLAFSYDYDGRGLVTERRVVTEGATTATTYSHDVLGRLTRSVSGPYVATYGWDASSNLVAETVSDDLGTNLADDGRTVVRSVDAANQVRSIVTDSGHLPEVHTTTTALAYDQRGNRVLEVLTRTTGATTHILNQVSHTFDAMDQVVGSHDTGANQNQPKDDVVTAWSRDGIGRALGVRQSGVSRARVFDGFDVVADGAVRVTRDPWGRVAGEAFERVVGAGSKATTVTVRRDVLGDVLGSATAVATEGLISADLRLFGDFGEELTSPGWDTVAGFTGAVDAGTGGGALVEFASRAYDPGSRVWVQADSYLGSLTASSSMNRYAYVQGAPESFTDTLGYFRAAAAIASQRLSAAEAAWLIAVMNQYLRTDQCASYDGCGTTAVVGDGKGGPGRAPGGRCRSWTG